MARADVKPINWEPLKWDPQNCEESLKAVSHRIEQMAQQPINWYLDARRSKSRCARWLRMGAIVATALAGLLPLLAQIFIAEGGQMPFSPAWASVALGLAALFVAVDKFFGCSTAWMRFIATEHKI
jgi:conflict system pore-forming effector with SLATT domain